MGIVYEIKILEELLGSRKRGSVEWLSIRNRKWGEEREHEVAMKLGK